MRAQEQAGLVLIVEDNRNISEMVGEYLESRGFEVDYASDGLDGYRLAAENTYDVIVLDLMLPRLDGIEVCKRLRNEARKSTPVLMLTARDSLPDKVAGFDSGADDYLVKPFAFDELLARLRAAGGRATGLGGDGGSELRAGDVVMDLRAHAARRGDQALTLTSTEWSLLECLLRRKCRCERLPRFRKGRAKRIANGLEDMT